MTVPETLQDLSLPHMFFARIRVLVPCIQTYPFLVSIELPVSCPLHTLTKRF